MGFFDFLSRTPRAATKSSIQLYNTLSKEKEYFDLPAKARFVRMYNCGPTVYGRQHIGNLSMYVFTDTLRKVLEYSGFELKHTINITDFGHLTSDADEGEDKMAKGLKREGLKFTMENMKAMADKYTNIFLEDIRSLNIEVDKVQFPRASEYINTQIAMIKTLEEKSYAYKAEDGMYFDTAQFPSYGQLGGIDLKNLKEGARKETHATKRNPTDFALWKFNKRMGWDAPWGKGFPGWHIECSAMIRATLGEQIDIHTGGIEHIAVHHNNEIAQSESVTGKKPLSRIWMHRNHIQIDGGKIAKSREESVIYLSDIVDKGFHPLALRYLFLAAHYRTPLNFTWDSLAAAQRAYAKLVALRLSLTDSPGEVPAKWHAQYTERFNDDLDTAGALATVWEMTKDDRLPAAGLLAGLLDADRVLGLGLKEPDEAAKKLASSTIQTPVALDSLPAHVLALIEERDEARINKNWQRADELRVALQDIGYTIEDSTTGTKVFKQ